MCRNHEKTCSGAANIYSPFGSIPLCQDGVDFLCGKWIDEDVTITLNHSTTYNLPSVNTNCAVKVSTSLTIASDTIADCVYVACTNQDKDFQAFSTVGFLFINMNVTVANIVFIGCGATLSRFNEKFNAQINSTAPYFTRCHAAFFTFVGSIVTFSEVTMENYFGFAIVLIDTHGTLLSNMSIKYGTLTNDDCPLPGSGVLILFTLKLHLHHSNVTVQNSLFESNSDGRNIPGCHTPLLNPQKVVYAASLTYVVYETRNTPILSILDTKFARNTGFIWWWFNDFDVQYDWQ